MATSTGYGPTRRLIFDGNDDKYELWEVKFLAHLRIQKFLKVVQSRKSERSDNDAEKNAEVFAELVQYQTIKVCP